MFPTGGERYTPRTRLGSPPAMALRDMSDLEAQIAEDYWDRLRLFAMRRLGDAAAAEDVAQEAVRRVVEAVRAGRVENMAALPAFVFRTASNICLHHRRSAGREARAVTRLVGESDAPSGDPEALATLINAERCAAVRRALDRLAPGDRELLRLAYYERLDAARIAVVLGIAPPAVRVRKHRALQRLAEALGEFDGTDAETVR